MICKLRDEVIVRVLYQDKYTHYIFNLMSDKFRLTWPASCRLDRQCSSIWRRLFRIVGQTKIFCRFQFSFLE